MMGCIFKTLFARSHFVVFFNWTLKSRTEQNRRDTGLSFRKWLELFRLSWNKLSTYANFWDREITGYPIMCVGRGFYIYLFGHTLEYLVKRCDFCFCFSDLQKWLNVGVCVTVVKSWKAGLKTSNVIPVNITKS